MRSFEPFLDAVLLLQELPIGRHAFHFDSDLSHDLVDGEPGVEDLSELFLLYDPFSPRMLRLDDPTHSFIV